jgi:hypothetical protein
VSEQGRPTRSDASPVSALTDIGLGVLAGLLLLMAAPNVWHAYALGTRKVDAEVLAELLILVVVALWRLASGVRRLRSASKHLE